jgi:CheY-like chemotaxis protein
MQRTTHIHWIDSGETSEFNSIESFLIARAAIQTATNLADYLNSPPREPPDAMILAQSRPGEFAPKDLDALRARCPLAPIVVLIGSWCEGDQRASGVPQGVVRIPWHAWHTRLPRELERFLVGRTGPWSIPTLCTDEERSLQAATQSAPSLDGLFVIRTFVYETWSSLADLLSSAGASVYWLLSAGDQVRGAKAIIWDIAGDDDRELEELTTAKRRLAAPVIALMGFPRADDVERLRAREIASVVAKPFAADELLGVLERLASGGKAHPKCGHPHRAHLKASIAQPAHFVQ